jgi:pilus assembly protein Flp/PilA
MKKLINFLKEEDGASLIEYVLLAALIGVAAIAAMSLVGGTASNKLSAAASAMQP